MNIEQELADFEAWWELAPILKENKRTIAEKAYQAGRAAQQSQDREDAERWRYAMDWDTTGFAVCRRVGDTGVCWEPIKTDGPIDHARRIEGDGNVETIEKLRALISDDSYAMSFQSLGQYRNALLKEIS